MMLGEEIRDERGAAEEEKPPKKSFLRGLLRKGSSQAKKSLTSAGNGTGSVADNSSNGNGATRRRSYGDNLLRKKEADDQRRPRSSRQEIGTEPQQEQIPADDTDRPRTGRGKGKRTDTNGERRMSVSPTPLTRWPPSGVLLTEELPQPHARELICRGAPTHRGHKKTIPHAPEDLCYALYTTSSGNRGGENDGADVHDSTAQLMTMRMKSSKPAHRPWETLEQPSYAFYYGEIPGTITLNQWASMGSILPPKIALKDSGISPRPMDLEQIFERLQELRAGLEDDDMALLYKILYRRILRDPDKILSPHKTLDKQITDLLLVLSRPDHWIDFTNPKNQVVTRFIFDGQSDPACYTKFFHQLLLSLELELRIHSRLHGDWAKEKLLWQIPPAIQWNLALARRWRQNVRIDDFGKTPSEVKLRYKLKKRQVKALRQFARVMKWPNLGATLDNLQQKDEEFALETVSSDAFAYFSGLVVPGPTLPFLMMNTLIDLDPDPATEEIALLSHMHPQCGFQYRGSFTYWSASCIVGKVLAPTCRSVAGWVGPARPTVDLNRTQLARIRTRKARQELSPVDVESMSERSEPLGPPAEKYPVSDYRLPKPCDNEDDMIYDAVRVELLQLKNTATVTTHDTGKSHSPRTFDASIQFAIDGVSWPLRLMYDVSFLSAWPCSDGPHPLFFDYAYMQIPVDEIVKIRDWGGLYLRDDEKQRMGNDEEEKVLVVEAMGVKDNEVLARAWCAHWGLCAIVADVRRTCVACAIREAYAATLTVVILVEGQQQYQEEDV